MSHGDTSVKHALAAPQAAKDRARLKVLSETPHALVKPQTLKDLLKRTEPQGNMPVLQRGQARRRRPPSLG